MQGITPEDGTHRGAEEVSDRCWVGISPSEGDVCCRVEDGKSPSPTRGLCDADVAAGAGNPLKQDGHQEGRKLPPSWPVFP